MLIMQTVNNVNNINKYINIRLECVNDGKFELIIPGSTQQD